MFLYFFLNFEQNEFNRLMLNAHDVFFIDLVYIFVRKIYNCINIYHILT